MVRQERARASLRFAIHARCGGRLVPAGLRQPGAHEPGSRTPGYTHFYDARGGGIACGFKQNQQGLGRRNKKGFAAQAVLLWLECLAHNVLMWARDWLAPVAPAIADYGLVRLVRDALSLPGRVSVDATGSVRALVLSRTHPLAAKLLLALQQLLAPQQIPVCLGEI